MDSKHILSTLLFVLFCLFMILFYIVGLWIPEQTNYWLVRDGLPIFFLEFFTIFALIFMPGKHSLGAANPYSQTAVVIRENQKNDRPATMIIISHRAGFPQITQKTIDASEVPSSRTPVVEHQPLAYGYWFPFLMILFMACIVTYFLDIWLLLYFFLALVVRYFFLRKAPDEEKQQQWMKSVVIPTICIIFSPFIAQFLAGSILPSFSQQIMVLKLYFQSQAPSWIHFKGLPFDNPGYLALWGVVYFLLLLLITLLYEVRQKKRTISYMEK